MDLVLFEAINKFALRFLWLDTLAIFFAKYLGYFLVFVLLLFLVRNYKKYWLMVAQSFLAAFFSRFVIAELIRWFWPRTRPFALQNFAGQNLGGFAENNVNLLFDYNASAASFPSGHASFFFALAAVVYFHNKKSGTFFLLAAFFISVARVFAGVHWPSDIIAGAALGIFSAWLTCKIFQSK